MSKKNTEISKDNQRSFSKLKSYSIDEILAAGGTTAFADKMGKTAQALIDTLEKLPKDAFLTEDEFKPAMETLNQSK